MAQKLNIEGKGFELGTYYGVKVYTEDVCVYSQVVALSRDSNLARLTDYMIRLRKNSGLEEKMEEIAIK